MSNRMLVCAFALIAIATAFTFLVWPYVFLERSLSSCESANTDKEQIECIFRIIESEFERGGIVSAMTVFSEAYDRFYSFASSGCHRYAHRVGDLAYYHDYLANPDLAAMEFPQETTSCGYGFYHGFLEHLIQDHPTAAFVGQTCEYLRARLSEQMQDIGTTCYHGSGHGFTLAEAERVPREQWGDIDAFTAEPLASCEKLSANAREIEDCKEGVFNVVIDWMAEKQYGFEYDVAQPFETCDALSENNVKACYYEMAQKLDGVSDRDPVRMVEILRDAREEYVLLAFRVGIAGIIQQTVADNEPYESTLARCATLEQRFFQACVESIVAGLFEHGVPQEEYKKPLQVCEEDVVVRGSAQDVCYRTLAQRLKRFYEPARLRELCVLIPQQDRAHCATTGLR